eukprot:6871055-Ditylum_brightwellii.AAC.1
MDPSTRVATISRTDHKPEGIEQLQDNEGTFVTTKRKYSILLLDNATATLTIPHSEHFLSEIAINNGFKRAPSLGFAKEVNFDEEFSEDFDSIPAKED